MFGNMVGRPRNADGKFMLVEIKNVGAKLNYTQKRLMQMMHKLFREADPQQKHYIGCYLLTWDHSNNVPVSVNNASITEQQFTKWITGQLYLDSLFDQNGVA